jgi:hypothetical protein
VMEPGGNERDSGDAVAQSRLHPVNPAQSSAQGMRRSVEVELRTAPLSRVTGGSDAEASTAPAPASP